VARAFSCAFARHAVHVALQSEIANTLKEAPDAAIGSIGTTLGLLGAYRLRGSARSGTPSGVPNGRAALCASSLNSRTTHLPIRPDLKISNCEAFKKWISSNDLLAIGPTRGIGFCHH